MLLACFGLMGSTLFAQSEEVSFVMTLSKEKLGLNERLKVEFNMNRDGDNFQPPSFEDFDIVMGPSQSVQNTWANGKRSFSKSYWYFSWALLITVCVC